MKKNLLLFIVFSLVSFSLFAQNPPAPCSELFISEYIEGTNNNKALEIYNPTNQTIQLNGYGICRNDNGAAAWLRTKFPAGATIAPYRTYVVVLDKRDTTQVRNSLEYPVFDGFQVWDTCRINGVVQIDSVTRRPVFCIQFDSISANQFLPRRGRVYNDFLDLRCRANGFINPVNAIDRTFYHNGNDAMGIFKGADLDTTGMTNLLDLVGIYNDPGMVSGVSWRDWLGRELTRDRTLVRKREVRNGTGLVAFARRDTFRYNDYLVFTQSSYQTPFQYLGSHTCDCDPNTPIFTRRNCNGTVWVSAQDIKPVEFKIYPNPTSVRNISIEAEGTIASIEIMDMLGRVVEKPNVPIQAAAINLNLQNMGTGIFFVKITTDDKRIGVRKLVVH
jgi:hypothetical protein